MPAATNTAPRLRRFVGATVRWFAGAVIRGLRTLMVQAPSATRDASRVTAFARGNSETPREARIGRFRAGTTWRDACRYLRRARRCRRRAIRIPGGTPRCLSLVSRLPPPSLRCLFPRAEADTRLPARRRRHRRPRRLQRQRRHHLQHPHHLPRRRLRSRLRLSAPPAAARSRPTRQALPREAALSGGTTIPRCTTSCSTTAPTWGMSLLVQRRDRSR